MKYLFYLLYIVICISVQAINGDESTFVLFILNILLLKQYLNYSGMNNLLYNITLSYYFISHVVFVITNYIFNFGFSDSDMLYQLTEGLIIQTVIMILFIVLRSIIGISRPSYSLNYNIYKNKSIVFFFFLIAFSFSFLANYWGISKMGSENTRAVVGVSGVIGIINYSRNFIFPILFVWIIIMYRDSIMKYLLLLILWAIFDAFIQTSRSGVIYILLPSILYIIYSRIIPLKSTIKMLFLIGMVGVVMFPIISLVRNMSIDKSMITIVDVSSVLEQSEKNDSDNQFRGMFLRTFMNGSYSVKYRKYLENKDIWHNYLKEIFLLKGSPLFTTIVVDGLGSIAHRHSSGTTPFHDGLLWFGLIGGWINFIILLSLIYLTDTCLTTFPLLRTCFSYFYLRYILLNISVSIIFNISLLLLLIMTSVIVYKFDKKTIVTE